MATDPSHLGAPGETVVALRDVGVAYGGFHALRGVSLSIGRGERVAIIGPSGAGKSTLLRVLNTSALPTSGRAEILGAEVRATARGALRAVRARIGTVWQQLHLVPQASVAENVRMGRVGSASLAALALGGLSSADRAAVEAVLARFGLAAKIDERLERLSGGEQQRVAIARVLHQAPELLLADEPLASVDPARGAEIVQLLLAAAAGRTLVVSTHQLEPVLPFFPRVIGLRDGVVLFDRRREALSSDDLAALYRSAAAAPSSDSPVSFAPAEAGARVLLRVAASTLPGDYLLPRLLPRLRAAHPHVRVRLAVLDSAAALAELLEGRADVALVGAREAHPDLVFADVGEDEIVLVAAPGDGVAAPLSPAALAALPRVDREPGSATRRVVEAQLAAMGCPLDPAAQVLEAGSPEAVKAAIAGGAGVGFASRLSIAADLAAGRLREVPVERLRIPRRIYAAFRRDAPPPAAAEALLALVRAEASGGAAR